MISLELIRKRVAGITEKATIKSAYAAAETEHVKCPLGHDVPVNTFGLIWSQSGTNVKRGSSDLFDLDGNVLPQVALVTSHRTLPPTVLLTTDKRLHLDRGGAIDELVDQNCRQNCSGGRDCAIERADKK